MSTSNTFLNRSFFTLGAILCSLEAQVLMGPIMCVVVALIGCYAGHLDGPMCLVLGRSILFTISMYNYEPI